MAGERNKGGRPSKLTPEVQERICELVAAGDRPTVAAGVCGIGRQTFYDWMRLGISGVEPFSGFRAAIAHAEDRCQSNLRHEVLTGDEKGSSFGPARAALEFAGRRFPREWAPKFKVELDESNRLTLEALATVCADPDVFERVRQEGNCSAVFEAFCERLSRLDCEGEVAADPGQPSESVH